MPPEAVMSIPLMQLRCFVLLDWKTQNVVVKMQELQEKQLRGWQQRKLAAGPRLLDRSMAGIAVLTGSKEK